MAIQVDGRTLPVLVGGAAMPASGDLPPSLRAFPKLQGTRLRTDDVGFEEDMPKLAKEMAERLAGILPWTGERFVYLPGARRQYLDAVEQRYKIIPLVIDEEHPPKELPEFIYQKLKFRADYTGSLREASATRATAAGEEVADIQQVLQRGLRSLIILGRPGGGKTTLLRHSMSVQAARAKDDASELLPIYLALPRLAPLLDEDERGALAAYFAQQNERALDGIEWFATYLQDDVRSGRAVLFLDGLDEVAEGSRESVKRWIRQRREQRNLYGALVVGTRFTGYDRSEFAGFAELVAQEMDDAIRLDLARKLLPVLASQSEDRAGRVPRSAQALDPETFVRRIQEHPQHLLWGGNPLLFSLAAYVYVEGGGELPPSTIALYGQSIRVLLAKVVERRHRQEVAASAVGMMDETRGILAEVALRLYLAQDEARGEARGEAQAADPAQEQPDQQAFSELRLLDVLGRIRGDLGLQEQPKMMAPWIKESGTLEVVVPGQSYTFRHHTYQEYLAAMALARRLVRSNERLEAQARQIVDARRFAARWSEPMRMLAGALIAEGEAVGMPDGQRIARQWLMGLNELSTDAHAPDRDAALELAVASLPEIPNLTAFAPEADTEGLLAAWAEALLRTARDGQTDWLGRFQRLAPDVALLPPVLSHPALARLYDALADADHPERQIAAARALEGMGDPAAVAPLERLLFAEGGDRAARVAAARALARVETKDLEHPGHLALERALAGSNLELARIVAAALVEAGDVAYPLTRIAITHQDAAVRRLGVRALGALGPRALPQLREMSQGPHRDPDPDVVSAALAVRKELGDATDLKSAAGEMARSGASAADIERTLEELLPYSLRQLGFEALVRRDIPLIVPPRRPVPPGEFLMGSDKTKDSQAYDNELPQHRVTLAAYQMAQFPVTVAEYGSFVRAGQKEPQNWQSQLERPDHPVVYVSWHDAVAYAAWLAELTGQPWRLPTEAEWEKAVRGTDGRIYPWGNGWDKTRANTSDGGPGTTTPVGSYPTGASPCGAQDLAGNVWEWTSSLFKPYPYNSNDGREQPESTDNRVLRGGSWNYDPRRARAAYRVNCTPDIFYGDGGFRVVLAAAAGS